MDRKLSQWFNKIQEGEIKLPRFQRYEAWDRRRITSLLTNILNDLPLGITLILIVGDEIKFQDRYIETAPETNSKVNEYLLDGQQRLTAFWRALYNNYENETYFVYVKTLDEYNYYQLEDEISCFCQSRYYRQKEKFPLWADKPRECYERGLIPCNLLMPIDIDQQVDKWVNEALAKIKPKTTDPEYIEKDEKYDKKREELRKIITKLRETVKHFNLPYLELPSSTSKNTSLSVFINMNTNSKPLSTYDIVVAEVESASNKSLHDLENELNKKHPNIKYYFDLSELILTTSALMQDKLPNKKGAIEMDKEKMIENWSAMERGLKRMAIFLESQGIYDKQRLPTNAVLAVIAALYNYIPDHGDKSGMYDMILKKYLWSSFFTDRYENSAATHAFYDFINLKRVFTEEKKEEGILYKEIDVPVLDREKYEISSVDELMTIGWPKQENIRGRAILAVASYLGAKDFATNDELSRDNIDEREYHHIFSNSLLEESGQKSFLALNCAFISGPTNKNIGKKDPLVYLKERYKWVKEKIVADRLQSHLIPEKELSNGGYENLTSNVRKEKIKKDYYEFLKKRAELVYIASLKLCEGDDITYEGWFVN